MLVHVRPLDLVEVAAVVGAATRAEWGLRRRTLPATADALGVRLREPAADGADAARTADDGTALPDWAVRRAHIAEIVMRRWPLGDTCLRRALVTGNRLAALSPELVIGVRPVTAGARVDAHAWVHVCGVDLDPLAPGYFALGAP